MPTLRENAVQPYFILSRHSTACLGKQWRAGRVTFPSVGGRKFLVADDLHVRYFVTRNSVITEFSAIPVEASPFLSKRLPVSSESASKLILASRES